MAGLKPWVQSELQTSAALGAPLGEGGTGSVRLWGFSGSVSSACAQPGHSRGPVTGSTHYYSSERRPGPPSSQLALVADGTAVG